MAEKIPIYEIRIQSNYYGTGYIGKDCEITIDPLKNTLYRHDSLTPNGIPIQIDASNILRLQEFVTITNPTRFINLSDCPNSYSHQRGLVVHPSNDAVIFAEPFGATLSSFWVQKCCPDELTGSEKIINGSFDSNISGWTAGSGWSWSNGKAIHTPGNTGKLSQTIVYDGKVKKLTIDAFVTAGSLSVTLVGSNQAFTIDETGQYTYYYKAENSNIEITPTSDFDGSVDNVSLIPTYTGSLGAAQIIGYNVADFEVSAFEVRWKDSSVYIGRNAGKNALGFGSNAVFSPDGFQNIISGDKNTGIGYAIGNSVINSSGNFLAGYGVDIETDSKGGYLNIVDTIKGYYAEKIKITVPLTINSDDEFAYIKFPTIAPTKFSSIMLCGTTSQTLGDIVWSPYSMPTVAPSANNSVMKFATDGSVIWDTYTSYTLPTASTTVLGGVKVDGTSIVINNGVISATTGGNGSVTLVSSGNGMNFSNITTSGSVTLGTPGTITGSSINEVTANSHTHALTLPVASPSVLGGVKVDNTTIVISNGVISATGSGGGMTNPMTASGDIIYGGTSGTPTRLPKGTDGQILKLVSGLPSWQAPTTYVSGVAAGNGMNFSDIYGNGTVTLGTPGTITGSSANEVTTHSHTHALSLPTATTSLIGGVKVDGTTITISNGVISSTGSYSLPTASTTVLGGVKVDGTTITISNGVISSTGSYSLPTASTTVLGGVKVDGTTITISNGVITSTVSGGMTNPMTASGDIIYGGSSGTPTRLPKGTDGQVLKLVSGLPSWQSIVNWVTDSHGIHYSTANVGVGIDSSSGIALNVYNASSYAIFAETNSSASIYGSSNEGNGVLASSVSGAALYASSTNSYGVWGTSTNSYGGVFGGLGVNINSGSLLVNDVVRINSSGYFFPANGVSGTINSTKTVTVTNGIITAIT